MNNAVKSALVIFVALLVFVTMQACTNRPKQQEYVNRNDTAEVMRLLIDSLHNLKSLFLNNPYGDTVIVVCENETLLKHLPANAICLSEPKICSMATALENDSAIRWQLPEVLRIDTFFSQDSLKYNVYFTVRCLAPLRRNTHITETIIDSLPCINNFLCGYGASMQVVVTNDSMKAVLRYETAY